MTHARPTRSKEPVRIYDTGGVRVATLHAGFDLTEKNLIHELRVATEIRGS